MAAAGLAGLEAVLGGIDGLAFVHLTSRDVVRHRIVQQIVDAYERADAGPGALGNAPIADPPSDAPRDASDGGRAQAAPRRRG